MIDLLVNTTAPTREKIPVGQVNMLMNKTGTAQIIGPAFIIIQIISMTRHNTVFR